MRTAIVEGLAQFRTEQGSYRLRNEFRCLIARLRLASAGERLTSGLSPHDSSAEVLSDQPMIRSTWNHEWHHGARAFRRDGAMGRARQAPGG